MIEMTKICKIRQLRKTGESVAAIAEQEGVSRDTVYKYIAKDDFSPEVPKSSQVRGSKLDPYRPIIDSWLEEDAQKWRKQRHTARRIWQRLCDEYGAEIAEYTVSRYVTKEKKRRKAKVEQFLDLVWEPGEAQADFGEADFIINKVKKRMYYFVLSFPHSNVDLAQVLPGENAECVCQGLKTIFEFIGGVPNRIVFDNATGVGRKVANGVRTTQNSKARASFSEDLQSYFDAQSKADLREELRLLHRESDKSGWEAINFELETRKERKRTRLINGAKFPALKSFES